MDTSNRVKLCDLGSCTTTSHAPNQVGCSCIVYKMAAGEKMKKQKALRRRKKNVNREKGKNCIVNGVEP